MSSELVASGAGKVATNSSSSSTFSSSSSSSFQASSSSSTKVMKSSTTSSSKTTSSSMTSSSSKSSAISIKSSGGSYQDKIASDLGIDVSKEMEKLKLRMNEEMSNIHRDLFRLMPITPPALAITSGAPPALEAPALDDTLVRLDADAIRSCIDKNNSDRMKLNFDVTEFESESISVKTVGNKIEVHAQKKSKKGDEERSEEFSRVYELPTSGSVDPSHVSSSIYQDGVLTIDLPVAEALASI